MPRADDGARSRRGIDNRQEQDCVGRGAALSAAGLQPRVSKKSRRYRLARIQDATLARCEIRSPGHGAFLVAGHFSGGDCRSVSGRRLKRAYRNTRGDRPQAETPPTRRIHLLTTNLLQIAGFPSLQSRFYLPRPRSITGLRRPPRHRTRECAVVRTAHPGSGPGYRGRTPGEGYSRQGHFGVLRPPGGGRRRAGSDGVSVMRVL